MPGLKLRSGRQPHEVFSSLLAILYGVGGLISNGDNKALESTFPPWARFIWLAGLIAGGTLTLVGVYKNDITGLFIERVALRELTILSTLYIIASIVVAPKTWGTALGIFILIGYIIANVVRILQIRRDLKENAPKAIQAEILLNGGTNAD